MVETSEKIWDEFQSKKRGYFVGNRPHAYGWVPAKGAERLSELILEIEEKYPSKSQRYNDIKQPVFAVHSEFDKTANIGKIEWLINNHSQKQQITKLFRIKEDVYVTHVWVILEENL